MGSKSLIRSRWAAIGAAVAVTLGGGGLIGVSAASGDASSLKTTTPTRIMDTRQGSDGKVSGETVALQVTGEITTYASNGTTPAATVVPAGANAVAVNLTVTQGERNQGYGFVTAFPCAADTDTVPNASTLNFVEGTDVANSTVVPLGATGKMCLNVYGSAHVIVDVSGYYETADAAVDAYTKAETDTKIRQDKVFSYSSYALIDREHCDAFEITVATNDDCKLEYNWNANTGTYTRMTKPSGYGYAYAYLPLDGMRGEGSDDYYLSAIGLCVDSWAGNAQLGEGQIAKIELLSGKGDDVSNETTSGGIARPSTITVIEDGVDEPPLGYVDGVETTGCVEVPVPMRNAVSLGRSWVVSFGLKGDSASAIGIDFTSFYAVYSFTQ